MKTGFIGAGNMAGAIIKGMVISGEYSAKDIVVFDVDREKVRTLAKQYGISAAKSENDVITNCDVTVFAVKPAILDVLLPKLKKSLVKNNPLIVSIAVGKTLEHIENLLGFSPRLIRVMPNINAKALGAMSAVCANGTATKEDTDTVMKIFDCVGKAIILDEKKFSAFAAISASSPAFSYMYIDALARSGVKHGMSKPEALRIAAQSVLGSAKMILESSEHPYALVDAVCSPAGTTIEGVASLQADAFESAIIKAVDAVIEKDKKM